MTSVHQREFRFKRATSEREMIVRTMAGEGKAGCRMPDSSEDDEGMPASEGGERGQSLSKLESDVSLV